jgi:hypothetical protein
MGEAKTIQEKRQSSQHQMASGKLCRAAPFYLLESLILPLVCGVKAAYFVRVAGFYSTK